MQFFQRIVRLPLVAKGNLANPVVSIVVGTVFGAIIQKKPTLSAGIEETIKRF